MVISHFVLRKVRLKYCQYNNKKSKVDGNSFFLIGSIKFFFGTFKKTEFFFGIEKVLFHVCILLQILMYNL